MGISAALISEFSFVLPTAVSVAVGTYFTAKGKLLQLSGLFKSFKLLKKLYMKKIGNTNSFSAVFTSLASTVGTGNISGVAGAVALGGAGAVFWMWVTAFFISTLKFAEIKLCKTGSGAGAMDYIKVKSPLSAFIYALLLLCASFFSGNIVQVNSVTSAVDFTMTQRLVTGVLFAVLCGFFLILGNKKIVKLCEKIMPISAIGYILLCMGVIFANIGNIPSAFKDIFVGAFKPYAVTGGFVGSVVTSVSVGASRGVFSNESGLGTSAIAHSIIENRDENEGYFGFFEVFADTFVICTLTALTILTSGVKINYGQHTSTELVTGALSCVYGNFSTAAIFLFMTVFAFSSVVGWALYGSAASKYIFGSDAVFKVLYPCVCIVGAVLAVEFCWRAASVLCGVLLTVNSLAIFSYRKEIEFE